MACIIFYCFKNIYFRWEKENDYCEFVKVNYNFERILDFVDIAIFDFIIGNGDRHRYEVVEQFNNTILSIDNGKRYNLYVNFSFHAIKPVVVRMDHWVGRGETFPLAFPNILCEKLIIINMFNKII